MKTKENEREAETPREWLEKNAPNWHEPLGGMNWIWAELLTLEQAKAFLVWLGKNGYESRGMYPMDESELFAVRWR